jgi:hypothetical protein
VLKPNGLYDLESARQATGMKRTTLRREIRKRRLRAAKRGGRLLILGKWLLEWVESGEIRHPGPVETEATAESQRVVT